MDAMDKLTMELKLAESKRENLGKAIDQMHSQVSSFLSLSLQWKELDEHFGSIQESIQERFEEARKSVEKRYVGVEGIAERLRTMQKVIFREVEVKSRELDETKSGIEEREREVVAKEKFLEKRTKVVEWIEKRVKMKRKLAEERCKEVEFREKQFELVREMIDKRFDELEKEETRLCLMKKSIVERGEEVELKERALGLMHISIKERGEEAKLEKRDLGLIQKSNEERNEEERGEEVEFKGMESGLRQNLIRDRCKKVESFDRELGLMQKSVEERGEEVELKEKESALMQTSIEERCEEVDSRERELGLMQESIEEQCGEVILKERLCLMGRLIDQQLEEVELWEERVDIVGSLNEDCTRELDLKEKKSDTVGETMRQCFTEQELKQKHLESSLKEPSEEAGSKGKQISSIQNKNEVFLQELELKGIQYYSNQEAIEVCSNNGELREKQLDVIQNLLEEHSNQLELKEENITLIRKSIRESFKDFEFQDKQSDNILHPHVAIDPPEFFADDNMIYSSADLRFCITMDGKNLQMFLNKRFTGRQSISDEVFTVLQMSSDPAKLVLDAMQGFYPPHLKEGNMEFEASVIRKSCILLLQQLRRVSPPIKPLVKEEAIKLAGEWKAKMRPEAENSLEVLGFLQLVATYGLAPGFNLDELVNCFQSVAQHRQAPESCQALGFAERVPSIFSKKNVDGNVHSQLKMEQLEYQANYAIDSSSASHLFFANIDWSMQLLPNEHSADEYLMIVNAVLQMSPNPAKLVLDALRGFYRLGLEKGHVTFKESDIRGCILLLEQLKKVSPEINSQVKEEAMKLVIEWKAKFREEIENSLEVLNFLLLLATYGLESPLNGDEVLILFKAVAHHKEAPQLCRDLGFVDTISDYVNFLIEKKERLKAIRYIYAFELIDKLPIVPLLQDHLNYCEMVSRKICKKRNYSSVARVEAAEKEIAELREVIKCVAHYKLESKFSPEDLEKRIIRLENQKVNRKYFAPSPARKDQMQLNSVNKRPKIAVSPEATQSTSNCNAPESQQASL